LAPERRHASLRRHALVLAIRALHAAAIVIVAAALLVARLRKRRRRENQRDRSRAGCLHYPFRFVFHDVSLNYIRGDVAERTLVSVRAPTAPARNERQNYAPSRCSSASRRARLTLSCVPS